MAEVSTHGRPVCWAVDVTTGLSALLLTLLWRCQVQVRYVSGTVAFHMAAAFAGENKTDAGDAVVIAQTIRMRPDIPILEPSDRLLAELTSYRAGLVGQRVATLFRLQELLTGISPALERAVDLPHDLRLVGAVTVSRHLDVDSTGLGQDPLRRVAVAAVTRPLPRGITHLIAQMFGQLLRQGPL